MFVHINGKKFDRNNVRDTDREKLYFFIPFSMDMWLLKNGGDRK